MNDSVGEPGSATPSLEKERMPMGEQPPEGPIPNAKLAAIADRVEAEVKSELEKNAPEWTLIGTRVGYYVPAEDDTLREYKIDRGDVAPLDKAPIVEITDNAPIVRATGDGVTNDPLTQDFLDRLYQSVEAELQKYAGQRHPADVGWVMRNRQNVIAIQGRGCCGSHRRDVGSGQHNCLSQSC